MRTTSPLRTEAHGDACLRQRTCAPALWILLWGRAAAHRLLMTMVHTRVSCAHAAHHESSQDGGAWGCLLATTHMCTSPVDPVVRQSSSVPPLDDDGAHPGPPACAHAAHHESSQDGRTWACPLARGHINTIPASADPGHTSSALPFDDDGAPPEPPARADAAHHQSSQDGRTWACPLARGQIKTFPAIAVPGHTSTAPPC